MANTIANVLTGVATLQVGNEPEGARAEWSDEQALSGTYSVKLSKPEVEGSYGSTHVQFDASGNAAAQTMADFEAQTLVWGWDHFRSAIAAYWEQLELRFEDPLTGGWVDITVQIDVMATGGAEWVTLDLADTDLCMFGGWSEGAGSFSNWTPAAISGVTGAVETAENAAGGVVANADDWLLTRIRVELWETVWERYVFIDDIVIDGITYTLEPGNTTTEGIRLSAPSTEVGYTEDGVTMEYTADEADIEVEEETFPIDRVITKETVAVTCNMAESSLYNMDKAMAGSLLSGSILKLGAGTNKKISLEIIGTNPAGFLRIISIPVCTATGAVGMPYKKGEKTVVPVTFQALKTADHPACTIVDNAA